MQSTSATFLAAGLMAASLTACNSNGSAQAAGSAAAAPAINQSEICETPNWGTNGDCKPGNKIVFLPSQFGNAQLPVMFAAANCDLRYSVVITNGAVTCIFAPVSKVAQPPEQAASASAPASSAK